MWKLQLLAQLHSQTGVPSTLTPFLKFYLILFQRVISLLKHARRAARWVMHRNHSLQHMKHTVQHAAEEKSAEDTSKSLVLWRSAGCAGFFTGNQLSGLFSLKPLPLVNSWVAMMTDQLAWLISFRRALENKAAAGWTALWVFFALLIEN